MMKKLKCLIEKIHIKKKLFTSKSFFKKSLYWCARLFSPLKKTVYIIGCPEYSNLGDNAILVAMINFLKKSGVAPKNIKCITEKEFLSDHQIIRQWIGKKKLICGLGGGNMGNQYYSEEKIRRIILKDFEANPVVIFPQTIYYGGVNRQAEAEYSADFYNGKQNLTMVAREKKSWEMMKQLYPDTTVLLTPDIVLSCTMRDYGVSLKQRNGTLLCLRNDAEKQISNSDVNPIRDEFEKIGMTCYDTDMHSLTPITNDNREDQVKQKMQEFAGAKIAITDRLHGMIFAALTETPCIVFDNYNHKVKGTYEWIRHLPYIKHVESVEEALKYIPELLEMSDCKYDNSTLLPLYDPIKEEILKHYN